MIGIECIIANKISEESKNNRIDSLHAERMHVEFSFKKNNADDVIN